jgi:hypothetical protein
VPKKTISHFIDPAGISDGLFMSRMMGFVAAGYSPRLLPRPRWREWTSKTRDYIIPDVSHMLIAVAPCPLTEAFPTSWLHSPERLVS